MESKVSPNTFGGMMKQFLEDDDRDRLSSFALVIRQENVYNT